MNEFLKIWIASILLLFSSCCSLNDQRVADGYPFGGTQELQFSPFKSNCNYYKPNISFFIRSKSECDSLQQIGNLNCGCNQVDFDKNMLVRLLGVPENPYLMFIKYQSRAYIDHSHKKCVIELRACAEDCSGSPQNSSLELFDHISLLPNPPSDYTVEIQFYGPVRRFDN